MTPAKRNLLIFGVVIVTLLLVTGLAFGGKWAYHEATKERPHWNSGTVIQKEYDPAHNESRTRQVYAGEDCIGTGSNQVCTPQYRTEWYTVYVPDEWYLRIQNCNVLKKDGSTWQHKDGTNKCFKKWVSVDQITYHQYKEGETYA